MQQVKTHWTFKTYHSNHDIQLTLKQFGDLIIKNEVFDK